MKGLTCLLIGLPAVALLFVPFAWGTSPLAALLHGAWAEPATRRLIDGVVQPTWNTDPMSTWWDSRNIAMVAPFLLAVPIFLL